MSQEKLCTTCAKGLAARNISGYCRPCYNRVHNADPATRLKISAGIKRAYAADPVKAARRVEMTRRIQALPQATEARRKSCMERRVWELGNAAQPKGSPSRQRAGERQSSTKLAHIPAHLRPAYRELVQKKFTAAEASALITEEHEIELARWRRKIEAASL